MGLQVATTEDLERLKDHFDKKLDELKGLLGEKVNVKTRWLNSREFMDKFDIKDPHHLATLRARGEVVAKQKGKRWKYDPESYLPS